MILYDSVLSVAFAGKSAVTTASVLLFTSTVRLYGVTSLRVTSFLATFTLNSGSPATLFFRL